MVGRSLRSGWIDVRLALGDLELMVELFGSVVVLDVLCSWAAAAGGFWRWDFEWEFENMSFRGTHGHPPHRRPASPSRPRLRNGRAGRGTGKFDVALVAVLSDAGLMRSEAAALTWGDVQRWEDGSGRITVIRSKTDAEAQGAVVAITPAAMRALSAIRPAGAGGEVKVFRLSESQIARRVKVIAKAAGLADWESFSGHSGRVGMARRMAQNGAPTHEIERQGRWKQGGGMVGRYTRGETAGSALRYL